MHTLRKLIIHSATMNPVFEERVNAEAVEVIDNMLSILKLNRRRPDATGARVAAIGRIQDKLEAERRAITERLANEDPQPEPAAA